MKYTPKEFRKKYGKLALNWPYDITHVIVIENNIMVYKDDRLLSSFPIILYHDGTNAEFVIHGKYKGYGIEGKPSRFSADDCITYMEIVYCLGQRHSEDEPAYESCHSNGAKYQSDWFLNGKLHRKNEQCEIWIVNGQRHRKNGPSYLEWHDNKMLKLEKWYQCGEYHRKGGPAMQKWDKKGKCVEQKWYVHGVEQESILTKRAI